jgi:hypothetical protein
MDIERFRADVAKRAPSQQEPGGCEACQHLRKVRVMNTAVVSGTYVDLDQS